MKHCCSADMQLHLSHVVCSMTMSWSRPNFGLHSHVQAPHSPFDTAMAHLSRRSAGSRPSKSQRLSGVASGGGGAVHKPAHHGSASLHASPRGSPRPSPRGSFLPGMQYRCCANSAVVDTGCQGIRD